MDFDQSFSGYNNDVVKDFSSTLNSTIASLRDIEMQVYMKFIPHESIYIVMARASKKQSIFTTFLGFSFLPQRTTPMMWNACVSSLSKLNENTWFILLRSLSLITIGMGFFFSIQNMDVSGIFLALSSISHFIYVRYCIKWLNYTNVSTWTHKDPCSIMSRFKLWLNTI